MIGQKRFAIGEWTILLGLAACAVAASELIGLKQLWEDAVGYTVVVFAVMLTTLPPAWGRESFWRNLALIFAGHMIAVLVVPQTLAPRRFGIPKLLLIPVGAIACVFIAGMLSNKDGGTENLRTAIMLIQNDSHPFRR